MYTPKLWCYTQLQFLEAHTQIRSGQSNFEITFEFCFSCLLKNTCFTFKDVTPPPESPGGTSSDVSNFSQFSPGAPSSISHSSPLSPQTTLSEFIDISTEASSSGASKEPQKKRAKDGALYRLPKDLASFKDRICEKRTKPFSWLGNLVATQMEEIIPEQQDDAAWEVQCLMRRLVQERLIFATCFV
ncbi:uncharacterized protein LOC118736572 [Rhagoletis pomonella]|uniref:uncharacterized protein LOC118736572 n=1 Tax=Rhagoletis pomonella TaxID=28610 RepID=UPI00177C5158|nr:uncharacterized protein LOC118736572 [Rhagoletis pomonella]